MALKRALNGLLQHRGARIRASSRAVPGWGGVEAPSLSPKSHTTLENVRLSISALWGLGAQRDPAVPRSIRRPRGDFLWERKGKGKRRKEGRREGEGKEGRRERGKRKGG